MVTKTEAYQRVVLYYHEFTEEHSTNLSALDHESLQIQAVLNWLSQRTDYRLAIILLNLVQHISFYFETRSLSNLLLTYVQACLAAAEYLQQDPMWIYMMASRANWALGSWEDAQRLIFQTIELAQPDSREHAIALQFLGTIQLNRGYYDNALSTLSKAKQIYHNLRDAKGEFSIQAEEAAYYLNKANYSTAYRLYSEVLSFELNEEKQASANTLLMMGVVSRRLKMYSDAMIYLGQLLQKAQVNRIRSSYATAAHHLAWVYIDQSQYKLAKNYGEAAETIYREINDPRGLSDADEQLGLIALETGNYEESQIYLEHSMSLRKELGNQQGYASSMRRMAMLQFARGRPLVAIHYLIKSLRLYKKIGMLPVRRVFRFIYGAFQPVNSLWSHFGLDRQSNSSGNIVKRSNESR